MLTKVPASLVEGGGGGSIAADDITDSTQIGRDLITAASEGAARVAMLAQEVLQDGVNIRTVNGIGLLGSGNIDIYGLLAQSPAVYDLDTLIDPGVFYATSGSANQPPGNAFSRLIFVFGGLASDSTKRAIQMAFTVGSSRLYHIRAYSGPSIGWTPWSQINTSAPQGGEGGWSVISVGTPLLPGNKILTLLTAQMDYTLPANMLPGELVVVKNSNSSTANARIVNNGYTISGNSGSITTTDNLLVEPGQSVNLSCVSSGNLEIV